MIMKKLPVAFRVKSIHNPTVYDDDDGDDDDNDVDDSDGEWPFPPRFQYVRPCRHEIVQTGKGKGCLLAETGGSSSAEYDTRSDRFPRTTFTTLQMSHRFEHV